MTTRARLGAASETAAETTCPGTRIAFNRREQFARGEHDRRLLDLNGRPTGGFAKSWGDCWKCHRPLGCTICTTTSELEVLCRACGAWGTQEALEHHGPIMAGKRLRNVAELAEYLAHWPRISPMRAELQELRQWAP